jgi:hypothetical protein
MAQPRNGSLIDLVALTNGAVGEANGTLKRTLEAIRQHLGMQVAYISEFKDDCIVLREVDAPGLEGVVKPGASRPADGSYCKRG